MSDAMTQAREWVLENLLYCDVALNFIRLVL